MKKNTIKKASNLIEGTAKTIISKSTGKPQKLYGLVFEATDACNSHCKHCNIWQQKPTQNLLTPAEIERAFQSPLLRDLREIIITGGEALLRPDLEEIMLIIHRNTREDALMSLSTNAIMPDRGIQATKAMVESGIQTIVGVSLDGLGEKHDEIRGTKGNFEKANYLLTELKKMKDLYGDKLDVVVSFTLSPLTVDSMAEVMAYSDKLGFIFLPQVYEEVSFYFNKGNVEPIDKNRLMSALHKLPGSFQKEVMLMAAEGKSLKFNCSSLKNFFFLHCNGDISPCLLHSDKVYGNLRNQPLDEIWSSGKIKEGREMIANCSRCYNTWGVGWSLKAWFPPFTGLLLKTAARSISDKFKSV